VRESGSEKGGKETAEEVGFGRVAAQYQNTITIKEIKD
jgi:hypothetical protein